MDNESLAKLEALLDEARGILSRVTGSRSYEAPAAPPSEYTELYRAAERRANEAEVRLSKLLREREAIQEKATASVREIQELAFRDELTGLANLNLLCRHLELLSSTQEPHKQVLLLIVDIDRFQLVNQVLGHDLGDQLLIRVGERLSGLVEQSAAVGRLAEDEFAVIVSGIPATDIPRTATTLCGKIRRQLAEPFRVQGQRIELTVSQGASYLPELSPSPKELIQQARVALTRAKNEGRDKFCLYNPELHRKHQRDAAIEFQLKYALDGDELFMEYLPFIKLERRKGGGVKGRMVGVEGLLRWRHRVEGTLLPDQFLPMAERSGQIVAIGERVIEAVCHQQRQWQDSGVNLFCTINLSRRQLLESDLGLKVRETAARHNVPPNLVNFEFQENFGDLDEGPVDRTLLALREAGFSLSLERFGEGALTLQRLEQVTFLKLGQALVRRNPQLCRKALQVARVLDLTPIGVGVESAEVAHFLLENGCDIVQGFYFSRPVPAKEIGELYTNPAWGL